MNKFIEKTLTVHLRDLNINSDNEYLIDEVASRSAWEIDGSHLHFYISDKDDYVKAEEDMRNILLMSGFEEENQKDMA